MIRKENEKKESVKVEWIVGLNKKEARINDNVEGWVSIFVDVQDKEGEEWEIMGRAFTILWQHEALAEIAFLTDDEWVDHQACKECGISHIDCGLTLYHC